jgi:hypothetical protein
MSARTQKRTGNQDDLFERLEGDLSSDGVDFEDVEHIVGDIQSALYSLVGKNPTSLCGIKLNMTKDAPFPTATARTCRKCAEIAGWSM